ncbi:MAG: VWA domain-containing protein, partial [Candidatus Desantisbacteria bacterium]
MTGCFQPFKFLAFSAFSIFSAAFYFLAMLLSSGLSAFECRVVKLLVFISVVGVCVGSVSMPAPAWGYDFETGDAIYRDGVILGQWHAGIYWLYTGGDTANTGKHLVLNQPTPNPAINIFTYFLDENVYQGNYTVQELKGSYTARLKVIQTAKNIIDQAVPVAYDSFNAVVFNGSGRTVNDIVKLRCDGFVEYCYEANGFMVWKRWANLPKRASILQYPDDHCSRPSSILDDSEELLTPTNQATHISHTRMSPATGTPPAITMLYHNSTDITTPTYCNSFTFMSVYATDDESGVKENSYTYKQCKWLDSGLWSQWETIAANSTSFITTSVPEDGLYAFYATVYDKAGNLGESPVTYVQIDTLPPPTPIISSPTHPDKYKVYANKIVNFHWTTPQDVSGIYGYSYLIDQSPYTLPDEITDISGTSTSLIKTVADGKWYFHLKASDYAGNWSSVGHYEVNVNATLPNIGTLTGITAGLVIDRSGSMDEENKLPRAIEAGCYFVDASEQGDEITISAFDDQPLLVAELTEITQTAPQNNAVKNNLKSAVNNIASGGSTNFGAGLSTAYNELSKSTKNQTIFSILMSDGYHNEGSYDDEVNAFKAKNWPIYTIGFGKGDDDEDTGVDEDTLRQIASDTGGSYYYAESIPLAGIYALITGKVKKESLLSALAGFISNLQTITHSSVIDTKMESGKFVLAWSGSDMDMVLIAPDGREITPEIAATDSDIEYYKGDTYLYYTVKNPMSGQWRTKIKGTDIPTPEQYSLSISGASPLISNIPGFKSAYNSGETINIALFLDELIGTQTIPIKGAMVSTQITKPDSSVHTLSLYDDGLHHDGLADDGLYATDYTNTDLDGFYQINITGSGTYLGGHFTRQLQETIQVGQASPSTLYYIKGYAKDNKGVGISDVKINLSTDIILDSCTTDQNGYYEFISIAFGTYTLAPSKAGYIFTPPQKTCVLLNSSQDSQDFIGAQDILFDPDNILIFPNPFKPGSGEKVNFQGLMDNATIRIYNLAGELAWEKQGIVDGKTTWDGKNNEGDLVASGTYIYIITDVNGHK